MVERLHRGQIYVSNTLFITTIITISNHIIMKHLKSLFTAILLIVVAVAAQAQIEYSGGKLRINDAADYKNFGILIDKMPGLYWTNESKGLNRFFGINMDSGNYPRIFGKLDRIAFRGDTAYNSIVVAKVYTMSDAKAKTNVKPLKSSLDIMMRLQPVSYLWKHPTVTGVQAAKSNADSDAVKSDMAYGPSGETGLQYGFLAQDVEKVLPDVVTTTDDGTKMIDYTAIIPLLVQSVQELQATVEAQAATIDRLQATLPAEKLQASGNNKILGCSPNPTSGIMTVSLQLESGVKSASIAVTSLAGNREKTVAVADGAESVELDLSALSSGIHIASLYVNGRLVDSVRIAKE